MCLRRLFYQECAAMDDVGFMFRSIRWSYFSSLSAGMFSLVMFDGLWLEWRHHIMAWATSFVTVIYS